MNSPVRFRSAWPIAVFAALTAVSWRVQAMTPSEVYALVSPSVWKVQTYDADGLQLAQGSAVVIAPETLVTNCHVLAKAKRFVIRREKITLEARLDEWDPPRDICQIKASGLAAPAVTLGDSSTLLVGQSAYAIGNPKGLDLTLSAGLVSSLRKNPSGQLFLIQTTAAISGGSSGGGLFDDNAALVGLTTLASVTGDAQNLNFAVPADWIRDLPLRFAKTAHPLQAASGAPGTSATADAAALSAPTPPPTTAAAPADNAYARIDDIDRLPSASEKMRARYLEFLAKPLPRAFFIADRDRSFMAWSTNPRTPGDPADPVERARQGCLRSGASNCQLYAIDNLVVYRPAAR